MAEKDVLRIKQDDEQDPLRIRLNEDSTSPAIASGMDPSNFMKSPVSMPTSSASPITMNPFVGSGVLSSLNPNAPPPSRDFSPFGSRAIGGISIPASQNNKGIVPPSQAPPQTPNHSPLHILGEIGKDVGSAIGQVAAPWAMPFIPGTIQHQIFETGRERAKERFGTEQQEAQARIGAEKAKTEFEESETQKNRRGETLEKTPEELAADFDKEYPADPNDPNNQERQEARARYALTRTWPAGRVPREEKQETPEQKLLDAQNLLLDPNATPEQKAEAQRSVDAMKATQGVLHPEKPTTKEKFDPIASVLGGEPTGNEYGGKSYANPQEAQKAYAQDYLNRQLQMDKAVAQAREMKRTGVGTYAMVRLLQMGYKDDPRILQMLPEIMKEAGIELPAGSIPIEGPPPGQPRSSTGEVVGLAQPEAPTSTVRTRGQMAEDVIRQMPRVEGLVNSLEKSGKLGPIAGRWNDFISGKIGADDPDYRLLKDQLETMSSAFSRLHLNTEQGLKPFFEMMNAGKMTPDNIRQALKTVNEWSQQYAYTGGGRQPGGKPGEGGAPAGTSTPAGTIDPISDALKNFRSKKGQ